MDWFSKAFVKAALVWLGLGVTLGVTMAVHPEMVVYRTAHLHMNLLGFVSMMIYGVSYHVMPRFTGNAIHNVRIAVTQLWLANVGLALLAAGFAARAHGVRASIYLLALGGVMGAVAAYCFIYNIWRTLEGSPPVRRTLPTAG
jgi:cytochrome c oxidase cbb3-type subunit 1